MRLKCIVSYDGSNYYGYQRQPGTKTIQGTIEDVIKKITKQDIIIYSSGRTDALVHAYGQVFHFDTDLTMDTAAWIRAFRSLLPSDIYVRSVSVVSDDFHSRFSLKRKEYRYYINIGEYNPFYEHFSTYAYNLDVSKMKEATAYFLGTHDFKGFAGDTQNKDTIRTIFDVKINEIKDVLEISFIGDGFLKYSVRIMVGTLIEIGLGKKEPQSINEVFESLDRNKAGKTAEAKGLFLYNVYY